MNTISKSHGNATQKVFAVICLFCLLFSLGAVTASAQGGSITASSCTVERGATASVTFNLQGNPGMFSLILKIGYDSSALTLKSVTNGSVFPDSEVVMGSLSANPFTYTGYASGVSNTTANGSLITLNFTVNENAAFNTYPVTVTQATGYDDAYNKFSVSSANGSVAVVECIHAEKEWRVTAAAKCDVAGSETLTCKKCGTAFDTRAINPTGHLNTEIRNAISATKTAEGYTGDTYCLDCGKLISSGTSIPKLAVNPPATNAPAKTPSVSNPPATSSPAAIASGTTGSTEVPTNDGPQITEGADLTFVKNTKAPLVFVSSADFSEFVRVEVDGNTLPKEEYTAESGSTVITVGSSFLNKLSAGEHTISIVSSSGIASTKFTVQEEAADASETPEPKSSSTPIIIVIVVVLLLAIGAAVFFVIRKRRSM